jgi:2-phosphoglycolate phosphatase
MSLLVLFDFDGTLADTAPDLAAAANLQRTARGLDPLPYEALRPVASQGARGLLRVALGLTPEDDEFPAARDRFLKDYAVAMYQQSRLFDGIPELLSEIEAAGLSWGIVTNKIARLAEPLIASLPMNPAVVVSGDTTAHAKPHPEPLLYAARQVGFAPRDCIYVGDDLRDIQAGQAAGMPTIAAAWGYCGDTQPVTWQADMVCERPHDTWDAIAALRSGVQAARRELSGEKAD